MSDADAGEVRLLRSGAVSTRSTHRNNSSMWFAETNSQNRFQLMPDITEQRKLAAIMFTYMVGHSADLRVWGGFEAIMPDIVAYPGIPSTLV